MLMIDHPLIPALMPDNGDAVYMPMHIGDSTIKLRRRPASPSRKRSRST
jgi:hypothetical protein